jgi:4-azaleucine resistance transporter AzlC
MQDTEAPDSGARGAEALTWRGMVAGVKLLAPLAIFVVPFGLAFGLAATERGMDPATAIIMSAVVFGGASQFAALDLWTHPLPWAAILITTGIVNARHLLYGAAIYPWIGRLPPSKRYPGLAVMTDLAWTATMQAIAKGERDAGVLLGGGLLLWVVWVLATAAGAILAAGIGDPKQYGLDVVMVAFFAASCVGLWRGKSDVMPWAAAIAAALAGIYLLPTGWHVIVGAFAGGLVGVLTDDA